MGEQIGQKVTKKVEKNPHPHVAYVSSQGELSKAYLFLKSHHKKSTITRKFT